VYNWLPPQVTIRSGLEGKRLRRFLIERPGHDYSFHSPVFLDTQTGERLGVNNGGSPGNDEGSSSGSAQGSSGEVTRETASGTETETVDDEPEAFSEFDAPVAEVASYCVEEGITDEDEILGTLNMMSNNPSSEIDLEMVESTGKEEIVTAIQNEAQETEAATAD